MLPKAPIGATRDLRNEEQVRLRIVSATTGVVLSTGVLIEAGEQVVDVPISEAERMERFVRDPIMWAAAEKHYARMLAKYIGEGNSERSCPYSVEGSYYTASGGAAPGWILELETLEVGLPPELDEEDRRLAAIHARASNPRSKSAKG